MAKATKTNNTITKEETIMAKYIVEVPEPKKGQKVSSGGIRENGKLAKQFKNPVPYKDSILPPTVVTPKADAKPARKEQANDLSQKVIMYFLELAWQEFGEPLLRFGFRKLRNTIIDNIESSPEQSSRHIVSPNPDIIDTEADEIETIYNDDKIIRFCTKKAI